MRVEPSCMGLVPLFILKTIYLFIWLGQALAAACRISDLVACGTFSCGMQTHSFGMWDLVPK